MIELRNVTVRSGTFSLTRISLQIEPGEYAVLMGTTGRGKTTLLESICGLRRVEEGQILIHGRDVTGWSPADREIGGTHSRGSHWRGAPHSSKLLLQHGGAVPKHPNAERCGGRRHYGRGVLHGFYGAIDCGRGANRGEGHGKHRFGFAGG